MKARYILIVILIIVLSGCRSPRLGGDIKISILVDGEIFRIGGTLGSTVSQVLEENNIAIGNFDIIEPPLYTTLQDGDEIRITRVKESFYTEEVEIPFEKQVVRSETIGEDDILLLQSGENGLQEVTWRILAEDGVESSRTIVKTVNLKEPRAEITMIGAQTPFTPLPIPGKIVLLVGGNAWLIEGSTGNRTPLVSSGDLDGYVFSLSPRGEYLLFTRKSRKPADEQINTLWVMRTSGDSLPQQVGNAANIIHFAGWSPNTTPTFGYTTVEPRLAPPGWQANNDFYRVTLSGGIPTTPQKLLEENSGGIYGWWGINFAWGSDGRLVYARPDQIGIVDQETGFLRPMMEITPVQTNSDWAWIPPMSWGTEARTLFVITHASAPPPVAEEGSPYFDLVAISMINDASSVMAQNVGMFSYPTASPVRLANKERSYQVAYLQAILPEQSDSSRYRVFVMDRDGSDRRMIFPPSDSIGLNSPQPPVWAPQPIQGQLGDFLAIVYQGNLWLVDSANGQAFQVTNDGLVQKVDWK